jgi:hypothetical protein
LARVLQRRTPAWGDRPKAADSVAESRWRCQPANVKKPIPSGDPKIGLTANRFCKYTSATEQIAHLAVLLAQHSCVENWRRRLRPRHRRRHRVRFDSGRTEGRQPKSFGLTHLHRVQESRRFPMNWTHLESLSIHSFVPFSHLRVQPKTVKSKSGFVIRLATFA